jgi:hypothetical protein
MTVTHEWRQFTAMMASDLEEEMFNKFTNATKGTKYVRQQSPTHQKNPKF